MNLRRLSYTKPLLKRDTEFIWKTKDKQEFHLYEMTHSHIVNCIQFLTKKNISGTKLIQRYIQHDSMNRSFNDNVFPDNTNNIIDIQKAQNDLETIIQIFEHELQYREQEGIEF